MNARLRYLLLLLLLYSSLGALGQQLDSIGITTNGTVQAVARDGNTLYVGGQFNLAGYQTGGIALTDRTAGFPVAMLPRLSGTIRCAVPDGTGGWYVGGSFTFPLGMQTLRNLLHVRGNHTVEPTFTPNPDGTVNALLLDGTTLFVGGGFANAGGLARRNLVALETSTGLATTWTVNPDAPVQSLVLVGSTLHVGGSFSQIGGQVQRYYAQVNKSTGAVAYTISPNSIVQAQVADAQQLYWGGSFSEIGYYTGSMSWLNGTGDVPDNSLARMTGSFQCIIPDGAGGWYAGGSFTFTSGSQSVRNLMHILPNRSVDFTFDTEPNSTVQTLVLDGQTLYAGGSFTNIGGQSRQYLAALDATSGLATTWDPAPSATVGALLLLGNTMHVGGSFSSIGGQPQRYYAQVDKTSGTVAHTVTPNSIVQALANDGQQLYLGGSFSETGYYTGSLAWLSGSNDVPSNSLARYSGTVNVTLSDGAGGWYLGGSFTWGSSPQQWSNLVHLRADLSLDPAFRPNPNSTVRTLVLDGQTLYVGGSFTTVGGQTRQNIAAIDVATGLATASWNPSANSTVEAMAVTGSTVYLVGSFTQVNGQAQRGFGAVSKTTGASIAGAPELNSVGNSLLLDGQNLYVGGSFSQIGGQNRSNLAVVNTTANAVAAWSTSSNGPVSVLATDGTVLYVGGSFSQIGGQPRTRLAALGLATGLATAWNPAPNSTVEALTIDGATIYVGGSFTQIAGQTRRYAAALSTTGAGTLTAWQPEPNSVVHAIGRNAAGTIMGGSFTFLKSQTRSSLAAMDLTTNTFTAWNPAPNGQVSKLETVGPLLYVCGNFSQIGGQPRPRLAALTLATGLATAWNPAPNATVDALAIDGATIYVGGSFTQIAGQARRYAAAVSATGTGTLTAWQPEPNGPVNAISRNASSTMLGGSFTMLHSIQRTSVAALSFSNNTVTAWNPTPNGQVQALALGGALVYVGGNFSQIGGQQRQRLAAVDNTAGSANTWNPAPNSTVEALAVDGTTVYAGGSFTQIGGQPRQYAAALSTTGVGALTAWDPKANTTVQTVHVTAGAVLLGGSFTFLKAESRTNLFSVDLTSRVVSNWLPDPNGRVSALLVTPSTIFAGGNFTQVGGQPRTNLAALNKTTGAASTWNPAPNGAVAALLLSGSKIYVGGTFTQISGQARSNLAAISATGTGSALAWLPNPNGAVNKISESDEAVYVCGSFTDLAGQARRSVGAIHGTTGALLPWNPNPNGTVQDLHVTARQVYLAGSFSRIGTTNRQNVAVVSKATAAIMPWNPGVNGAVNDIEVKNNFVFIGGSFTAAGGQTVRNFASLNANTGLNNDWYPNFNSTIQTIYIDNRNGLYVGGSFSTVDNQQTGPYVRYSFPRNYFRPRLDAVTPNVGGNIGDVAVDVIGSGFADGTTLQLTRSGQPSFIVPDSLVGNTDGIRLQTSLNLSGLAVGDWNAVVTVPNDTVMTLANSFRVEVGEPARPWVDLMGFNAIRRGQWQSYTVVYGNNGNVNAVGVPLWIAVPSNVEFEPEFEVLDPASTTVRWDSVGTSFITDSLYQIPTSARLVPLIIPVIRPGEVQTLGFRIKTTSTGTAPIDCQVWTTKPLYNSMSDTYGQKTRNQIIDCWGDAITTVAGLIPGVGCAVGILDVGIRPAVHAYATGDHKITNQSFFKSVVEAAVGCIPGGKFVGKAEGILKELSNVGQFYSGAKTVYSCTDESTPDTPNKLPVKKPVTPVASFDPNDKIGNSGIGGSPYVNTNVPFRYLIRFENYATASAAAQEVIILDTLDVTKLDPATLQLGYVSFGNRRIDLPRGLKNYTGDVDLRPSNNLVVRVTVTLNETTGLLRWAFTSLDPATMRPTLDPLAGFLPPNVTAPEGEGGVFYTIMPRAGLTTHTAIRNRACIYFDTNPPICTPTWVNNVDNVAPVSSVQPLAAQQISNSFTVNWSGSDAGSGIHDYTIYSSVNGRPYRPWISNTHTTSAVFTGVLDSTYRFYSIARDTASNQEAAPTQADAITRISQLQVVAGANETVCLNAAPYTLTGFSPAGGTWSGRGVSAAGLVTPTALALGNNELVYTVTVSGQSVVAAKIVQGLAVPATPTVLRIGADSVRSSVAGASYEWRVNNVVVPATTRTIRITQAGTYTVQVRATNGCLSTQSMAVVLSAARAQQQAAIQIYPNPASRRFTVASQGTGNTQAKIHSIQIADEVGRLVYETQVRQAGKIELPTPIQSGVYIVRVFTDKGLVVQKLTVMP